MASSVGGREQIFPFFVRNKWQRSSSNVPENSLLPYSAKKKFRAEETTSVDTSKLLPWVPYSARGPSISVHSKVTLRARFFSNTKGIAYCVTPTQYVCGQ